MKRKIKKDVCRIVFFVTILVLFCMFFEQILQPKWYYNPDSHGYAYEGDTPRYKGFYRLEKNSLDYIGLGPSHIFQSINPTLVYAESGYKGYILSGSGQGLGLSYVWLKEALKYQHPKYVFLSAISIASGTVFGKTEDNYGSPTKQVLNMRPSIEKIEASFICDSKYKRWWEYLFPIFSFHTRWDELSKDDFYSPEQYFENGTYISFDTEAFTHIYNKNKDVSLISDLHENTRYGRIFPIKGENVEYLDKIERLCKEKEIELVLVPTISSYRDYEVDQFIEQYALAHELDVLYINEDTADLDWLTDSPDTGWHLNYWGNSKASKCFSDYLIKREGKSIQLSDSKWESDLTNFSQYETEALLTDKDRVISYLEALSSIKDNSIILCAVLDDACGGYTEQFGNLLSELGLEGFKADCINHVQESYISVIDSGFVKYESWYAGPMELNDKLSLGNGTQQDVDILSGGYVYGNIVAIKLNYNDVAVHSRGLNIVVIDKMTGDMISSVCIDSHDTQWSFTEYENNDNSWIDNQPVLDDGYYLIDNIAIKVSHIGNGVYTIEKDDKYLTIPGYSNKSGIDLTFEEYTGLGNQKWIICKSTSGKYNIYSLYSHLGCVLSDINNDVIMLGDTLYTGDDFSITMY